MEAWYYEVVSIDGDYANLRRTDIPSDDLKLVARRHGRRPAKMRQGIFARHTGMRRNTFLRSKVYRKGLHLF